MPNGPVIEHWNAGIVNDLDPDSIPENAASDALNWLTLGDKVELRRGYALLGNRTSGSGKITGLRKGIRPDGTEVLIRTRARKVESYDSGDETWDELGSNALPAAADGEDVSLEPYHSEAGAQMFLSSVNSGMYKILLANRESIKDLSVTDYKGKIKIAHNRIFLWNRKNSSGIGDETGLYLSYIDNRQYNTVSAESIGTGNGSTTTFSGTLAAITGVRTAFAVTMTDGVETFTDNRNGILVGSAGGTGTINYTTGAYSITFNTAPASLAALTATYRWENSTNQGLADFSFNAASRVAGTGDLFRQDSGGPLQSILVLSHDNRDFQFCMHEKSTWLLELTQDDNDAQNFEYRVNVGIPSWRAAKETSIGIVYVDQSEEKPRIKVLRVSPGTETRVEPLSISNNINLTAFRFDQATIHEWSDYIIVVCRTADSTVNNRMWLYNKKFSVPGRKECWDLVDYYGSVLETSNGTLVAGDPIQHNTWTLFSGYDDDGSEIPNYWIGKLTKLQLEELKRLKKLVIEGLTAVNQACTVSLAPDRGNFVEIGEILGTASYVDRSQEVYIGPQTLGTSEIGGGSDGTSAFHYTRTFDWRELAIDTLKELYVKFECTKIGHFAFSKQIFEDLRVKSQKSVPLKYRS